MDPRQLFVDQRLLGRCAYCGGDSETRDHVPSKIFLDEPFPEDLPVIDACLACNNNFSLDEQYMASLIDCVITGSARPGDAHREKIRRTLERRPGLQSLIQASRAEDELSNVLWKPDSARVNNVILKLARGHLAYEYCEQHCENPENMWCKPICFMADEQIRSFEESPIEQAWPEIGSRAFIRAVVGDKKVWLDDGWQIIQKGRYRYMVTCADQITVKLVLSEYLACEVTW